MTKRFAVFISFLILVAGRVLSQEGGRVVEDSLYSPSVASYMRFNAILPADYSLNDDRFTTIYLLHGYNGGYNDWVSRTRLVEYAKSYNLLIVTPDAKNSWYTNSPELKNNNFEDYIIKDLITYVEKKYRTLSTRHGRAIVGLSMGGYGAMKFGLKYPSTFFFAASLSGAFNAVSRLDTLMKPDLAGGVAASLVSAFGKVRGENWTRNDVFALVDSVPNANMPYLYISIGKDDVRLIESNRSFAEKLRKKGALYEYHETPGTHSWVFWDKEISNVLWKISDFDPLKP
jgi:S-formylglutathione hydrolase FrmB